MRKLTLLGPQRQQPNLAAACQRLGVSGSVAAITAGWQEREAEVDEMREHLGCPVADLMLHARCDRAFAADRGLFLAHRVRQNRLRELQRLYRYRLDFAHQPARELLRREGDPELLEPEREAAIRALRQLDEEHLARIVEVHRAFEDEHPPGSHPALEAQRAEVAAILAESSAVLVAGGHVAVLLNRLRLFRLDELIAEKPIIAWSAGAMVLAERVVLFHDSPPQGAGNAEVFDQGLGLVHGLLPLPHAHRRLRLADPYRVALFARRFAPALCVPLDDGSALFWDGDLWRQDAPARRLLSDGQVAALEAA